MSQIVFFVQKMHSGGVENALISLTRVLSYMGHKVTVCVVQEGGEFTSRIPDNVKLLKLSLPSKIEKVIPIGGIKLSLRTMIIEKHYVQAVFMLLNFLKYKSDFSELSIDFSKIQFMSDSFDIAVNFHIHSPFLVRYLAERVNATKKLSWIHNDFTTTSYEIRKLKQYLDCCDDFFCVSQRLVDEFISIFPEYRNKTHLAYNLIMNDEIIQKSNEKEISREFDTVPTGFLKILSVGRLEVQKGYDLAIDAAKKLVDLGCEFKWFIMGEGTERSRLERKIKNLELQNTVYLVGVRKNPYPYFKDCDIYVQPSRHEGYVTTVTEAKIFNKPIVCTDVSGATEQIKNGITGDIAQITIDSIVEKLHRLMVCKERRDEYSKALSQEKNLQNVGWLDVFGK